MFDFLFSKNFKPDTDIPNLAGKVILITGANTGLGYETARQLAKHDPSELIIAARTESKAQSAIAKINAESPNTKCTFLSLDLSSLASVKAAADTFTKTHDRLDILINNAGIMAVPFSLTQDGFEVQLGTCHVGHALLTNLLLPTLLSTAAQPASDVRIINLSSDGHQFARFSGGMVLDPADAEKRRTEVRYGSAKLANILHARALRDRYPTITTTSCHPGVIVETGLFDATRQTAATSWLYNIAYLVATTFTGTTTAKGALNTLWCATADRKEVGRGYFFRPIGLRNSGSGNAQDQKAVDKLWDWTNDELKQRGYDLPPSGGT